MGALYIIGAVIYAMRIPERFFPGKCDIWVSFRSNFTLPCTLLHRNNTDSTIIVEQFQSHQIFHVFVIVAAFVHYHGITEMAMYRMSVGECPVNGGDIVDVVF